MKGFVTKSIAAAGLLFVAYNVVVPRVMPKWRTWQSTSQTNVIKAQRYLYDDQHYRTVILGSSLATRLVDDSLPADVCNLAFGGQNVQDGLAVLAHRDDAPRWVVLETNFLFRPENRNFQRSQLAPGFLFLRRWVPALRDEYQPVGVLKGWASARSEAAHKGFPMALTPAVHDAVFDKMLALQEKDFRIPPRPTQVDSVMQRLAELIHAVEARGARIAFFEMPVDPALMDLPYATATRSGLERYFPLDRYPRIPVPDPHGFNTADALHLDEPSALSYTIYLRKELARLP